jgi:hypothetical protein
MNTVKKIMYGKCVGYSKMNSLTVVRISDIEIAVSVIGYVLCDNFDVSVIV